MNELKHLFSLKLRMAEPKHGRKHKPLSKSLLPQSLLIAAVILVISFPGCSRDSYKKSMSRKRTSVLWLTLCTLRADHMGIYGYKRNTSPFMDSLAKKSVIFDRAFAPASWTRASIASSITGLYPRTLDIEEPSDGPNNRQLLDSFQTLAEVLRENGYYTIGITANPNTHSVFNFDQGFDYYEDTGKFLWRSGYSDRKRDARDINASLLRQLRKLQKKKFFAHMTYVDVHTPLLNYGLAGRFKNDITHLSKGYIDHYDEEIRYLDSSIGSLLQEIGEMGYKDLLVIINSDHGEAFGYLHEGDVYHGHTLYNETLWVPLIFYHPSLERVSGRRPQRINTAGLMPTLLDLLAIKHDIPPGGARSFTRQVFDASFRAPDSTIVSETCFGDANESSIMFENWKLIATYKPGNTRVGEPDAEKYELFLLSRDWHEAHDLSANMPGEVEKFSSLLGDWQAAHNRRKRSEKLKVKVPEKLLEKLRSLGYVK